MSLEGAPQDLARHGEPTSWQQKGCGQPQAPTQPGMGTVSVRASGAAPFTDTPQTQPSSLTRSLSLRATCFTCPPPTILPQFWGDNGFYKVCSDQVPVEPGWERTGPPPAIMKLPTELPRTDKLILTRRNALECWVTEGQGQLTCPQNFFLRAKDKNLTLKQKHSFHLTMDKNAINAQASATTRTLALTASTTEGDGDHGFLQDSRTTSLSKPWAHRMLHFHPKSHFWI